MDEGYKWLESIAERMKGAVEKGAAPGTECMTVHELLGKFRYERRSEWINNHIRNGLERFSLKRARNMRCQQLASGGP